MALLIHKAEPVGDESLDGWESVGSGGFGHVYKSRHKDWGFDVAIKIPHDGFCGEEANHMETVSCEFVLRVYGLYQGCPPVRGTTTRRGIVMEFMERGALQSLLNDLCGPPPWPLAFRLARQVALGMNFLHSRSIMHHDLKPSNVLLNDDLNAKLADFGLSRVSTSASNGNRETNGQTGGSYKYMPPEAFKTSYEPVRAFDIYSYGILLWSIFTGKEPYQAADYSLVALKIPMGDRPPCEEIDSIKAEGLEGLADLMKRCWDGNPSRRPTFKECLKVTEDVFLKHKSGIHPAVQKVLTRLQSPSSQDSSTRFPLQTAGRFNPVCGSEKPHDTMDGYDVRFANTERSSMQHPVSTRKISDTDKAKFVDNNRPTLIQSVSDVMTVVEELGVRGEPYAVIEAKDTSQEKMRELYDRVLRGEVVKAAFYDALNRYQPKLMESLGGSF